MSQEKVDRYKKEKANRKENMRKEKMLNSVRKCVISVAGLVLVGWIGYSVYATYDANKPVPEIQIDYRALDGFAQNLEEAEAADEQAAAEEEAQ